MKDPEIENLPEKYRPISGWGYFGYMLLFAIPLIGQIFLIVFAISGSNINRRGFARSYFCALLIILIVAIVGGLIVYFAMPSLLDTIKAYFEQFMSQLG